MGFKQIFYLGLDLKNIGYLTHFFGHDFHSIKHDHTEYPKMKHMLNYGAKILIESDVHIYNCSPDSNLESFKKVSYDWAIAQ